VLLRAGRRRLAVGHRRFEVAMGCRGSAAEGWARCRRCLPAALHDCGGVDGGRARRAQAHGGVAGPADPLRISRAAFCSRTAVHAGGSGKSMMRRCWRGVA
jgi:hypothetical protein